MDNQIVPYQLTSKEVKALEKKLKEQPILTHAFLSAIVMTTDWYVTSREAAPYTNNTHEILISSYERLKDTAYRNLREFLNQSFSAES